MNNSLIPIFDIKKHGFYWFAVLGYFIGSLLAINGLPYKLLKTNYHLIPKEIPLGLFLAAISTLVFFLAIYIAESDWQFILYLSTGCGVEWMARDFATKAMFSMPQSSKLGLGAHLIFGLIYGFTVAFLFVFLGKKRPASVLPFLISFPVAIAITSIPFAILLNGIDFFKAYLDFAVASVATYILLGMCFYLGYLLHYRKVLASGRTD